MLLRLSLRDKQRSNSSVVAASSSDIVVRKGNKRHGSANDAPTMSVSEPNILPSSNHKPTRSSGKHKSAKHANENSNNSNGTGHNLRRGILSASDTTLNKMPHRQSSVPKPVIPKSGSKEDIKMTSPEQVIFHIQTTSKVVNLNSTCSLERTQALLLM